MNRALWELQEIDNIIIRIKRERGKLDDGSQARGEHDTLQRAFDEERSRLSRLNAERTDRELGLKSNEERIARQQSRLMSASSAHEITALERDIKALNVQRGDFDEAILGLMDDIETSSTRLRELENELKISESHLHEIENNFARETARLENELAKARAQREGAAAKLSAEEIAKYDLFAKNHASVAVARVENGHCSMCGMVLPTIQLKEAKAQSWPTCESCGRLLFME